jgi:uncharacterized membrane protein/ribosomal protein L40E
MGGVAAILLFVGVVSQVISAFQLALPNSSLAYLALTGISGVIAVLSFVGFVLFFIAMYGFSKDYAEHRIFHYILYGLIAAIVAGVIAVVISVFVIIISAASQFSSFSSSSPSQSQITSLIDKSFLPILPVFAAVALIWIIFNVRAFNLLADKSKVFLFRTGAKVLLAGALVTVAVTIIFAAIASSFSISYNTLLLTLTAPGAFVQDAAWALMAIAYFRIQAPLAPAVTPVNVAPFSTVSAQVKYCSKCGAPNQTDAVYCTRCGQKL